MRVFCIFPIVGHEKKQSEIARAYLFEIEPELRKLGATSTDFAYPTPEYENVPKGFAKVPGKGEGIIGTLKGQSFPPNCVIVCDGSGKIPYKYMTDIFQELVSSPNIHCVMANRVGYKAITIFRYLLERFEIFVLCQYYNHPIAEIPDGQAGLWGYKCGPINNSAKEIKLIAQTYDIELDLVSEILGKKIGFSFLDVDLPKPKSESKQKTMYSDEDNTKKMLFLLGKLENLKDFVMKYAEEFEKSKEFLGIVNSKEGIDEDLKEQWNGYKDYLLKIL